MRAAPRAASVDDAHWSRSPDVDETRVNVHGCILYSTWNQFRLCWYILDYLHPRHHKCFQAAIKQISKTKQPLITEVDVLIDNQYRRREICLSTNGYGLFIINHRPGKTCNKIVSFFDYRTPTHNHYVLNYQGIYLYCKNPLLTMADPVGLNIFDCVMPEFKSDVRAAFDRAHYEKQLTFADYGFRFKGKTTFHRGTFRPFRGQVSLRDVRIPDPRITLKYG